MPKRKLPPKDQRLDERIIELFGLCLAARKAALRPTKTGPCTCTGEKEGACALHASVAHELNAALSILLDAMGVVENGEPLPPVGLYRIGETKTAVSNELTAGQTLGSDSD